MPEILMGIMLTAGQLWGLAHAYPKTAMMIGGMALFMFAI